MYKRQDLGHTTGEMAVKILKGESNVSDMPIEYTDVTKKYNKTICDDLGLPDLSLRQEAADYFASNFFTSS